MLINGPVIVTVLIPKQYHKDLIFQKIPLCHLEKNVGYPF